MLIHLQIREIPSEMRLHLPARFLTALETKSTLKRGRIQKVVMEMAIRFRTNFELVLPPLNAPLVMFKHVKELCLPRKSTTPTYWP